MLIKTKTKRRIYIFLAIILGILLGVMADAFFEKARLEDSLVAGTGITEFLPSIATIFLIAGVMLGYVLGVRWWQIVYVEKRHWRNRKKTK